MELSFGTKFKKLFVPADTQGKPNTMVDLAVATGSDSVAASPAILTGREILYPRGSMTAEFRAWVVGASSKTFTAYICGWRSGEDIGQILGVLACTSGSVTQAKHPVTNATGTTYRLAAIVPSDMAVAYEAYSTTYTARLHVDLSGFERIQVLVTFGGVTDPTSALVTASIV